MVFSTFLSTSGTCEPALSPVSVNCISGGLCYNCLRNDLFTTQGPVV